MQKHPQRPIYIIDDENDALFSYKMLLRSMGFSNILLCNDSRKVMDTLSQTKVSIIILDLNMPHVSGETLLEQINEKHPDIPVVVITAVDKIETAVACMKRGSFDYMTKPVEKSHLSACIYRALEIHELKNEVQLLKEQVLNRSIQNPEAFAGIITKNEKMISIFRYIEAIAASTKPVLITGESGVGKELLAKALYRKSNVSGEFVPVNVAGLDDVMFSDTLFGHTKGAFTGADSVRQGLIKKAEGGILFLDEIGDMEMQSQLKLLRLLQEREYVPLGSDVPRPCNAHIVAATNVHLEQRVKEGTFRKDLFYRLATHHIEVPALRERLGDLRLLMDYFLQSAANQLQKSKPRITGELLALLASYSFPGNIRELESLMFDALARNQEDELSLQFFHAYLNKKREASAADEDGIPVFNQVVSFGDSFPTLKEVEEYLINEAMSRAEGNQSIAARILGISQSTLSRRFSSK